MFKKLRTVIKNWFTIAEPKIQTIDDLESISKREKHYLKKGGVQTVEDLLEIKDLTQIYRIGDKTNRKIQNELKKKDII
jgi:hypothetical protein